MSFWCRLDNRYLDLGCQRQGQGRPYTDREGVSRHHLQSQVPARQQADALPRTQDRPPPQSRKHLPASGLVKCHRCNRALSGQDAKSGQFSYYVCQSIMKRGKDACDTPRLNARRFEEMVVGKIRSNVLTEGNIRALVKVVDEQMDGVARE